MVYGFILHISYHLLAFRYLSPYKKKKKIFFSPFFPHKKQNPKTSTLRKKLPICELHVGLNAHFSFLSKRVRQTATVLVSAGLCILSNESSWQKQEEQTSETSVSLGFCLIFRLYLLLPSGQRVIFFSRLRLLSEVAQ